LKIRGIIFDLGGVAVEWSNSVTYNYVEQKYGIPSAEFRREAEKGMPRVQTGEESEERWMRKTFQRFGPVPEGAGEVWGTTFEVAHYNEEMIRLVKRLRRRGYRVAALSNLEPSRARWLRGYGIDELFDVVVFSCEVGERKPDLKVGKPSDLAVYRLTLSRLGLKAKECIFIDDNVNCVAAAESMGLKSIIFKNTAQVEVDLREMGVEPDTQRG
jgi:HAD superfamily hydrolase (TIGR01509 family)